MIKVKVYAKAAMDFHSMIATYAYSFLSPATGERFTRVKLFKTTLKTLAQADCAAYGNALYILSGMAGAEHITEIECITDSHVVVDMLTVYKSQKHCEDICRNWREATRPSFKAMTIFNAFRVSRKPVAGDANISELLRLNTIAQGELKKQTDFVQ